MSMHYIPTPNKTYATVANAIKAVEAKYPASENRDLQYIIYTDHATGRFFPIFTGGEKAIQQLVHFSFHVV